jgi:hypothetical protein
LARERTWIRLRLSVRVLAATSILLLIAWIAEDAYVRACLPLYRIVMLTGLPYGTRLEGPMLKVTDSQRSVAYAVVVERAAVMAGQVTRPGGRIDGSTPAGHALQHPVLIGALVLAWPGLGRRRAFAAAAAIPLLVVLEMVDIPLVLLGTLQDSILAAAGRDPSASALVAWMYLLDNGGRLGLSLAVGLTCVWFARWGSRAARAVSVSRAVPPAQEAGSSRLPPRRHGKQAGRQQS